jgi:hypothetical protein
MFPKKMLLLIPLLLFPIQLFRLGNEVFPTWVAFLGVITGLGIYYFTYRGVPLAAAVAMMGYDYVIFANAQSWIPPYAVEMVIGWLASITLLVLCCTKKTDVSVFFSFIKDKNNYYYWTVLAITLFGLGLRLYRFTEIPVLNGDEASITVFGMTYFDGTFANPFISGWLELPAIMTFFPGLMVHLFGTSIWAMRFPALFFGVLSIPLAIWTVRPILERPYALLAGFAFATIGMLIHFSRLYYVLIFDLFCIMLVLGFIMRSEKGFSDFVIVIMGVISGIKGAFTISYFMILMLIWTAVQFIRMPDQRKKHIFHIVLYFAVTTAVAGPLLLHYYQYPNNFRAPLQRASLILPDSQDGSSVLTRQMAKEKVTAQKIITDNMLMSFRAVITGPVDGWYKSNGAILPSMFAFLFLIGLAFNFTRWRSPSSYIVAVNILFACLSASLSYPVAAGHRMVSLMGSVVLLIGLGAQSIDHSLRGHIKQKTALYSIRTIIVAVMCIGAFQGIYYYFNTFVVNEAGEGDISMQTYDQIGHFAEKLPSGTKIDVYENSFLNRDASGVLPLFTKHLNYLAVTEGVQPRKDAQVLVIPPGRRVEVLIPTGYRIVEAKSRTGASLITFAVAPTLEISP